MESQGSKEQPSPDGKGNDQSIAKPSLRDLKVLLRGVQNIESEDDRQNINPSTMRAETIIYEESASGVDSGPIMMPFVQEVEEHHNSIIGKMKKLREALRLQLEKQEEEVQSDEREDVQKKTFAKWINSQLSKGQHPPVTDLFYDLRDGTRLLQLLEVLTGNSYKREKGRMRVHHLNNVSRALGVLEENKVKLINISNEHIVDGSAKLTLGLVWAVILHWQVQGVLKDVMADLQQTNLEKTLLAWCRQTTKGYHGVDIRNFTTSWSDGLAFNAILHSHRQQLFDYVTIARKHPYARLENAFRLANEHFEIERLLDPEDVNSQVPDKKSIMMYVMCLFQALPHDSFTMESLDESITSDSSLVMETVATEETNKGRPLSNVSIGLSGYQRTLEEVLTWLLGAEDRLAAMPPISENTELVKDQFHELEELMLELTSKQGGIGDVLGEGSRLLREGVMGEEEEEEVRVQMKLLNTRWEELRVKAMDRQSQLHERLMCLQEKQLGSLKKWLTDTEDRIANMNQLGPTIEELREQVAAHQALQKDLEAEQGNINSLSNMVVVVDESNGESAYCNLEDSLNALGERWAHICKWTEQRWNTLQGLSIHWEQFQRESDKVENWVNEKQAILREFDSKPSMEVEQMMHQAGMLQVMQAEMDLQQRRFAMLQEESTKVASYLPSASPVHEKLGNTLETLQDRWEALSMIIEAQTARLSGSGIDISAVVIPGNGFDVVNSTTATISSESATVITKIVTTKMVTTEVSGGVVKRQKLEGGSQEDFTVALHSLGGWMDQVEKQLEPSALQKLSLDQLIQLCQHLEQELIPQQEEYGKVMSLGQSAISENSTIGESPEQSEAQMGHLATRWEALQNMLAHVRSQIGFLSQKQMVLGEMKNLERLYIEFHQWFELTKSHIQNEPRGIKVQLEQCKEKISEVNSHNEEVASLVSARNAMSSKWPEEAKPVMDETETTIENWKNLLKSLEDWNNYLSTELQHQKLKGHSQEDFTVALQSLGGWMDQVEKQLQPSALQKLSLDHLIQLCQQLEQEIIPRTEEYGKVLSLGQSAISENSTIGESSEQSEAQMLHLAARWEALQNMLDHVRSQIGFLSQKQMVLGEMKNLERLYIEFHQWFELTKSYIQNEPSGIKVQLEQCKEKISEVNSHNEELSSLVSARNAMSSKWPEEAKPIMDETTTTIENWKNLLKSLEDWRELQHQKLEGKSREDFTVTLHSLGGWMDQVEKQIEPSALQRLSLDQLIQLCQHLEQEVIPRAEEYSKVMSLGQSAISENSTIGKSPEQSEVQMAHLATRWEALQNMLAHVRSQIGFLSQKQMVLGEMKKVERLYIEFHQWFELTKSYIQNEPSGIKVQLEQCKEKISEVNSHNEEVASLSSARNAMSSKWLEEAKPVMDETETTIENWKNLLKSLEDWSVCLSKELLRVENIEAAQKIEDKVDSDQKVVTSQTKQVSSVRQEISMDCEVKAMSSAPLALTQAMEASRLWLGSLQTALAHEHAHSTMPKMQDHLTKYKDLLEKVQVEQGNITYINDASKDLLSKEGSVDISDDVVKLNNQWDSTITALKARVADTETAIEGLRQYGDEVTGLRSWLSEVETFIKAEEAALGDLETLEAQLEQSNALQDDILTLQNNFTNVSTTAQQLIKEGDSDLVKEVEDQLKELEGRWKTVTEQAKIQNNSLKDAHSRSKKVNDDIQKFNTWLDEVEKKIPSSTPIETSGDLSDTINVFSNLHSEINDHTEAFKSLNETGDIMLQAENTATHDSLARQFTQLNGRWTEVVSQIDSRYKTLTTAQEQYHEFKKLCGEETSWLDQLEQKLEKSSKSAADAEEISEALDELEIFLHSHSEDRLDSVRSLAENLVREGVMTVAVQNSTHTLTSRFNHLSSQASEQQVRLEGGVREAQAWEREYVSVLDYLQHTDMLLTQATADPMITIEISQVRHELLIQQSMLKKMTGQVELYQNQGKTEAAVRLQDQIAHLHKKCEEVESKLGLLGEPSEFEERFNQVSSRLQEVSHSVNQVTLKSGVPEEIQEQLNHCLELYQVLSSVKSEVESVISTGRKIVKDGQSTNPDELTKQCDDLKALYNQLGGAVTDQRGSLERSIRNARKIQKDSSSLEDWLSTTEGELDRREATVPAKSLQHEMDFAQHAIDDIGRKKPLLTGLHESYSALTSESKQPQLLCKVKDQVDDIAATWERVNTRLVNRLKNLKVELETKESEMESFILGLGNIKAWLESSENTLSNLCDQDLDKQEKSIKKLSGEVQDYKNQIEHIRDTAVDLIAHGTLFQDRIQPELVNINQRWENISRTVQKQSASVSQSVSSVSKTSTSFVHSTMQQTTTTMSAEDDEVESYLREVTSAVDKISSIRDRVAAIPSYEDPVKQTEAIEQEVALMEPDVATVISRGDTLTLTTHMVDVPRANSIRIAVNDLRKHWTQLKTTTEDIKSETSQVNREMVNVSTRVDELVIWITEVTKRLHLVNNDESQLEALEREMSEKKSEIDELTATGELLKKYRYQQLQPTLTMVNTRWLELTSEFRQYRKVSLEQKTITSSSKIQMESDATIVPNFVARVNRLREGISSQSRQLGCNALAGNRYDKLKSQEEQLKVIKQGLDKLKPFVDDIESERNATVKNITPAQSEQMRRVMDKLREEWAQVNRGYTERHATWLQCCETWRNLQKTIEDFFVWLNTIEQKVQNTNRQPIPDAKITQKELEKQVTIKHRPSQTLQSAAKEVIEELNTDDGKRLQERVDGLMKRWRALLLDLAARRERIACEEGSVGGVSHEYESLVTWVEQSQALMDASVNVTDEASLAAHTSMVQNHLTEMSSKQNLIMKLKESKPKGVSASQMSTLEANMNMVCSTLPEYKNKMDTKLGVIRTLSSDVEDLYRWTEDMRVKVALGNLQDSELRECRSSLSDKSVTFENLDSTYWVMAQDAESKGLATSPPLKNRMATIEARLAALQQPLSSPPATPSSPSSSTGGQDEEPKHDIVKEVLATSVTRQATQQASTTTVTTSTIVHSTVQKAEHSVVSSSIEKDLRPPSPLLSSPQLPTDSSPSTILASLDKSILQIRDWLTLMEQMTRQQTVLVGDPDDIRSLTEKQKNVLRELESKKPQLDELVASADSLKDDASRTQLHQKVSKLREHWDETNSVVLARKTQLDAMLGDTHKFDVKRLELEQWLARMEARIDRMHPVAHTADVLDQQIREQKALHAEIHQYKHQVEHFNQMTQRLIAIYQHDDTSRLKKITETVNLRYNSLNSSIIGRGKTLHSAMNSLHNFDKALDKFACWMSEAESSTDMIDVEVDKLGPTRRDPHSRGKPQAHLKDLQSEIETHKDVLASLNATGQKLLGTLENQDEAVMLQRRLEEMNQRWNALKHKSVAIRNRLEGNAENWNTLLLSLRELIEWVIRKDTDLSGLGPLVGDIHSLGKFSDDLGVFRRAIDEKQPVIETNLKSGRQLIASEPPLSDTSDSEAGRDLEGDARYRGEESGRDLTRAVRREVAKLSEKWAALRERAAATAAQADHAHKKLTVLQKTVGDVSGRLEEAEKIVATWGSVPHDSNLADQHAHNVRKFREGLADLQRGVDDVNDQAARFSAHNVPLTPNNSAKLHDLNNRWKNLEIAVNDRWRQVAGRSREVTPLTPAQLASSVAPPWERATTSNKVPYYINHDHESTHWDHPLMMEMLDGLTEFNHIKFSAYRTATKLRVLQKKLALDHAKMQMATDLFDEHGLRGQNDRLIDINDMVVVLSALYSQISADHPEINITLAMDLCLNWLLNVYDSQRTGQMRVLSFKIGLVCLCRGHLEEKYRYMFRLIADPNRLVDQRKLGLLLHDCVQVPRQLGEVAAFGGSNIEPSVRSCFTKAGKDRETVEAVHFLSWVQQEPQSLVWLAVLHRVAASENIQHQVKCNICKTYPIIGLRYRCLKCLSFDMCQRCFFDGRSGKSHKVTHPMHEYCTATTAGEDVKDFTKALKNKFKSKRSLQKHTKKGYLPVQTVLEGDALESPSPSPQHNVSSQDMHSRLEAYASRLAEVELRTNSNSTPDSEDEHGLIAQYCQSLSSSDAPLPVPRSPIQIMAAVDADQKDELEQMIRDLEDENQILQAEYDRLRSQQPVGSPPDDLSFQRSETEMLAEAKLLRQHKGRLEARMGILEEHNRQLEAQLHRLRQLLGESGGQCSPNKSGTLQTKSVTASQLAMDSPAKINGHSNQGDLGKAVGNLVATMNNQEQGNASPSTRKVNVDDDDDSGREESGKSYDDN